MFPAFPRNPQYYVSGKRPMDINLETFWSSTILTASLSYISKSTTSRFFFFSLGRIFAKSKYELIDIHPCVKYQYQSWVDHFFYRNSISDLFRKVANRMYTVTASSFVYLVLWCGTECIWLKKTCYISINWQCMHVVRNNNVNDHYNDVIMGAIASQITSLTIVFSIVYSDADERKYQSSVSLAFVQGIHRGPVNSPHKWPVTRKMFSFDDVIMWNDTSEEHVCWIPYALLIVTRISLSI